MVIVLALASAFLFGLASVLQHRGAQGARPEQSMRPGLLLDLVRTPVWLAGQGAALGAFAAQATAVSFGALAVVQPVLTTRLVFGLMLASRLSTSKVAAKEWVGAVAIVAGLAAFLTAASPGEGTTAIEGAAWLGVLATTVAPAAVLAGIAPRHPGVGRAMTLAGAGALMLTATVTLTKVVGHDLRADAGDVLTSWELYALAPTGLMGLLLVQSAFMAGPIRASLPVLTSVEALGAIAVGALFLDEAVSIQPAAVVAGVLALVVVIWGVVTVTSSRALVETLETH